MTPVFITIFILVSFLSIIALGIAVSAEVKVKNVTNLVKLTQDSVITGKPLTIVLTLTINDAFSTNQYVFISGFGNFIVDSVETNICTVFNLQALEDTTIPVNTIVHPSGSGTFSRTTKPATVLAGTFSLFVRDSCFLDKSVVFESSSGILSMTVLSITAISNIEAELSVLNSDGIGIGSSVPILSKVSLCGTGGAAGTSGSGLLAKVGAIVSQINFGTGVTVTIPISEGFDNLHGPRVSSGLPNSLLYIYILSDIGGTPYNLYFQVNVKNTSPDEVEVTLVDHQINAPFDIPPGVSTLTIAADTGIFFAGDSPAYIEATSLNVPNTVVKRDGSGDINFGDFTSTNVTDNGTNVAITSDLLLGTSDVITMGSAGQFKIAYDGIKNHLTGSVGEIKIINLETNKDITLKLGNTDTSAYFNVQNSSGTKVFRVDGAGNINIEGIIQNIDFGIIEIVPDVLFMVKNSVGNSKFYRTVNNNTSTVLYCSSDYLGTDLVKCVIQSDGDIENVNGSYGTYSDRKLKENIRDARSYWEDMKRLKVRQYNRKDNPDNDHIGLVAQELIEDDCFPSLVKSVKNPANENDPEETLAIKTTVFIPILLKTVQELIVRVEESALQNQTLIANVATLTARITALENP